MTGCDLGWKIPSVHATKKNKQTARSSSHSNDNDHDRFSMFEEDYEEDAHKVIILIATKNVNK